jgi:hypothetical protein
MRGGVLQKQSIVTFGADKSVLRQGIIWRHLRSARDRSQPALNDLRRLQAKRWCDAVVQTLRF